MKAMWLGNIFPTFATLYEQYTVPYEQIVYEGNVYKFIRTMRKGEVHIDIYRDGKEQHTVEIHLIGKKPFYIETYYQIQH